MKSDEIGSLIQLAVSMNPLQRALIEKAGHDNGFEYVLPGDAQHVALASARHPARVRVSVAGQGFEVAIDTGSATLAQELARTFATSPADATTFVLPSEALLAHWLRRTAALSQALPNQAVATFEQQVQAELSQLAPPVAQSTEVLRMVRQRLGQQAYRQAMLDYWGGRVRSPGWPWRQFCVPAMPNPGPCAIAMRSGWMFLMACCWRRTSMRCSTSSC